MATPDPTPPAPEPETLTLEQVLEQVSTADPQTFYREARRFDEAAGRLQDVQDWLSKHRRDLADAWRAGDKQQINQLDRLIRHVEGVVSSVQNPGYPRLLRQIGDAIADTKQRLNDLKDGKGNAADDKARADVDKRAAQLLDELSTSYRRLGGELVALPERTTAVWTATAGPGSRIDTGSADAAPVMGAGTGVFTLAGGSVKQQGFGEFTLAQSHPVLAGSVPPPEAAVPFARFSQYAGCPAHAGGPMQSGKSVQGKPVAGLSGRADLFPVPNDSTTPPVLGRMTTRLAAAPTPAGAGGMDRRVLPEISAPARLEAQPAAASAGGVTPVLVSTGGPATQPVTGGQAGPHGTATAAGFAGDGPHAGGSPYQGSGPNHGSPNATGPNGTVPNAAGPGPGGTNTNGPAASTPVLAQVASPTPATAPQTPASPQVPPAQAQITGVAGAAGIAPPQPPGQVPSPVQAPAPTQVRPVTALGAEHLQMSTAVSPGAPGMPLAAFTASSNFAQSSMPAGTPMHSPSPALPAGPHGVLGAVPRADGVWLRADPGCWTSVPVAAPRLGRDDIAAGGNTWGTERHVDYGKEGR